MDVQCEKTGPCQCKLSITIPADTVEAAYSKAFKDVSRQARVPGFRPGKAPKAVIEAHYGEQVKNEVEQDLIRSSLGKALDDNKLVAVATPHVESGELKRGAPFAYKADIETQPEIALGKYEGLEVPDYTVAVADADVDIELEKIRKQAVQLAPVLDRDVVQNGDLIVADYEGTQGGMPLKGAKAQATILEIGDTTSEEMLPGVSAKLLGAKVPSERSVPVDFPQAHPVPDWRGKSATFRISLKELKKKDLPNLDDEFAKDLGEESLAELKKKLLDGVAGQRKQMANRRQREVMLKQLVAANPFPVPPSMIAERVDRMIIDAAARVRYALGPQFDLRQLDLEKLRVDNREGAEFQVRCGLLLLEVAKAAKLEVSDDEINAEVERMAAEAGEQAERLRANYANPEERQHVRYKLLEDRTVALLLDKAKKHPEPFVAEMDDDAHDHDDGHDHDHAGHDHAGHDHAHDHDHDHDHEHR